MNNQGTSPFLLVHNKTYLIHLGTCKHVRLLGFRETWLQSRSAGRYSKSVARPTITGFLLAVWWGLNQETVGSDR
jgi:hypothetical protein